MLVLNAKPRLNVTMFPPEEPVPSLIPSFLLPLSNTLLMYLILAHFHLFFSRGREVQQLVPDDRTRYYRPKVLEKKTNKQMLSFFIVLGSKSPWSRNYQDLFLEKLLFPALDGCFPVFSGGLCVFIVGERERKEAHGVSSLMKTSAIIHSPALTIALSFYCFFKSLFPQIQSHQRL